MLLVRFITAQFLLEMAFAVLLRFPIWQSNYIFYYIM